MIIFYSNLSVPPITEDRPFTPPPPRERLSYTRYQLELLNGIYEEVRYPNSTQKQLIAKRVGITREQVKVGGMMQCVSGINLFDLMFRVLSFESFDGGGKNDDDDDGDDDRGGVLKLWQSFKTDLVTHWAIQTAAIVQYAKS